MGLSTSTPRMRVLVIFCALVSIAIAGDKGKGGKGGKGGKVGKGGKNGKGGKGDNGSNSMESMTTMMGGMGEIMQEMMDEKEGLCLSNDQVHMMCGIGTKLQEKMDAALKQCVPPEMMAATMENMQDTSMTHDMKLLSSGRAFTFDEPSERKKNSKKKSKKDKKPSKKNKEPSKKNKKPSKMNKKPSKKPSKPSDFKSCEASCSSLDEMRSSAMEEMKTELCVLNAIGWMDDEGNMMQDVEDADMAEFPEAVREAVSEAKIKDCAEVATAAKMEAMMKDKKFQKKYGACFENECYSEEDMEAMTKMMEMMAGMQCWDRAFTKACKGHIKENLMNMASNMLMGK